MSAAMTDRPGESSECPHCNLEPDQCRRQIRWQTRACWIALVVGVVIGAVGWLIAVTVLG